VHHEVFIDELDPRHDGLRIAHLTDLHVGRLTPQHYIHHAVTIANHGRADVIVLTGDYVCWSRREIELLQAQLAGLRATRVIVVLGNHDYFTDAKAVVAAMESHGYEVLQNRHTLVEIGGGMLSVIGIDDPVTGHDDIESAMSGVKPSHTTLALSHCPEVFDELVQRGVDLVLSGHTHGAQIYINGLTDRIWNRTGRRFRNGLFREESSNLYVSPGVGFSGVRARIGPGTRAEVALLTLRRTPLPESVAAGAE
jgi:predicted MPP superfamily phosphohydrolase